MFKLRHIGIRVRDLESMKIFFISNFNCKVKVEMREKGVFIDNLQGKKNVDVTTCKLIFDESDNIIELLYYHDDKFSNQTPKLNYFGINHYAVTVKNLTSFYENMVAKGFVFTTNPIVSNNKKALCTFMYDIENNLIELVEEL